MSTRLPVKLSKTILFDGGSLTISPLRLDDLRVIFGDIAQCIADTLDHTKNSDPSVTPSGQTAISYVLAALLVCNPNVTAKLIALASRDEPADALPEAAKLAVVGEILMLTFPDLESLDTAAAVINVLASSKRAPVARHAR